MNSLIDSSDFGEFEEEYLVISFISMFTYFKKFISYTRKWLKKKYCSFGNFVYNTIYAPFESKIVPNDTYNHLNRNQSKIYGFHITFIAEYKILLLL